jgi:hypothetical protein
MKGSGKGWACRTHSEFWSQNVIARGRTRRRTEANTKRILKTENIDSANLDGDRARDELLRRR